MVFSSLNDSFSAEDTKLASYFLKSPESSQVLKFEFSEKHTKFEKNLPQDLDVY